eukprot:GGOE01014462.1.p1 GENE.GGOE01014462.1~~GGOE01014462.1.p1  ORF type:complete len:732 (+),score=78.68 GGOE01014462.1:89-2197(+)
MFNLFNDEVFTDQEQVCCGRDCQMNTIDVHPLDFQSNIYSLAGLHHPSLPYPVVFVATCARVYCLLKSDTLRQGPSTMQIFPLREYPQQYRILGVGVFPQDGNVVLGLTFVAEKDQVDFEKGTRAAKAQPLKSAMPPGQFHIYVFSASYLRDGAINTLQVARWQRFDLSFTPLKLLHHRASEGDNKADYFLLAGTDRKIHFYSIEMEHDSLEYWDSNDLQLEDDSLLGQLLPSSKASRLPSSLLCLDIATSSSAALLAMGGQDGHLSLSIVGLKNASVLGSCAESTASTLGGEYGSQVQRHSLLLTGPIASVQLYSFRAEESNCHHVVQSLKHRAAQAAEWKAPREEDSEARLTVELLHCLMPKETVEGSCGDEALNLLVAEATGRVFVFLDVLSNGLSAILMLPDRLPSVAAAISQPRNTTAELSSAEGFARSGGESPGIDSLGGSFGVVRRFMQKEKAARDKPRALTSSEMDDLVNAYLDEAAMISSFPTATTPQPSHEGPERATPQLHRTPSVLDVLDGEVKDARQPSDLLSCDSKLRKPMLKGREVWPSLVPSANSVLQNGVTFARACNVCGCGMKHLMVGTWDNRLLYYAPLETKGPPVRLDDGTCRMVETEKAWIGYQLTSCVEYDHPIYGLYETDINGDGVKEVVVCGQFDCYVLQPKPRETKARLHTLLPLLNDILLLEDELRSLEECAPQRTK